MSRTDAHRPWWVQANDDLVPRVQIHDHRGGSCDMGPRDAVTRRWCGLGHCYWDLDMRYLQLCSCHMCHPKYQHGKDRSYWRDQLREVAKIQNREDIDIPPFIDKGW